ncbi:MAG: SCO family protein [Phycisphaerales bacterium]
MNRKLSNFVGCASVALCCVGGVFAQDTKVIERDSGVDPIVAAPKKFEEGNVPFEARGLDVEEKVGLVLPLELQFTDDNGKLVSLGDYFATTESAAQGKGAGKPAVMVMAYYACPVVCRTLIDKLVGSLNGVDFKPGKDYSLLVFSFDPKEQLQAAKDAKEIYASQFRDEQAGKDGFHFHVSPELASRSLADALGFRYKFLPDSGQFSHPVVVFIATPDGKISRYLYGFEQEPKDLKLAIMEASEGKLVRTIGERLMNFCYMYDSTRGAYTLSAMRVMQVGAGLSVAFLGSLVGGLLLVERVRKRRKAQRNVEQVGMVATG